MPRNDRSCCTCEYTPSCCQACDTSACNVTVRRDIGFEITPAVYTCTNFEEIVCDPNCDLSDIAQSDEATVQRKTYGCLQEGFTTSRERAGSVFCTNYYFGGGGCGYNAYFNDWYNNFYAGICGSTPSVGGGVVRERYRAVSGNLRINFTRSGNCLQNVSISSPTGNPQYSECIVGTDHYMVEHGRTCDNTDPPSGNCGLDNNPTCKQFSVGHFCNLCPFCPPYYIQEGQPWLRINATLDVIRDYSWAQYPTGSSNVCVDDLPDSDTSLFFMSATMAGTMSGNTTTYSMVKSELWSPDYASLPRLVDVGVDFDNFTI